MEKVGSSPKRMGSSVHISAGREQHVPVLDNALLDVLFQRDGFVPQLGDHTPWEVTITTI